MRGGWLTYGPHGNKDGIVLCGSQLSRGRSVRVNRGKLFGAVSQRGFLARGVDPAATGRAPCATAPAQGRLRRLCHVARKGLKRAAATRRSGGTSSSNARKLVINPGIKSRIPASRIGPAELSACKAVKFPLPNATRTRSR